MVKLLIAFVPVSANAPRTIYSIRGETYGTYWLPDLDRLCNIYMSHPLTIEDLLHIRKKYDICIEFESVEDILSSKDEIKLRILLES